MKNFVSNTSLICRNISGISACITVFLAVFLGILMTNSEIKFFGIVAIKLFALALVFHMINIFINSNMLEKIKYKYLRN